MKKETIQQRADKLRREVLDMVTELHLALTRDERGDEQDYIDDTREQIVDTFDVVDDLIGFIFCNEDELKWANNRLKGAN